MKQLANFMLRWAAAAITLALVSCIATAVMLIKEGHLLVLFAFSGVLFTMIGLVFIAVALRRQPVYRVQASAQTDGGLLMELVNVKEPDIRIHAGPGFRPGELVPASSFRTCIEQTSALFHNAIPRLVAYKLPLS